MKKPVIYKIENIDTGNFFLNFTDDFKKKKQEDLYDLNHGCHSNSKLQNAWVENIRYNISILKQYSSDVDPTELCERLFNYITKFGASTYNSGDSLSTPLIDLYRVPVVQLSLDNEIIKFHPSVEEANISLGKNHMPTEIYSVIYGELDSAFGFRWIDNRERKSERVIIEESTKRGQGITPVEQIDSLTGEVVNSGYSLKYEELGFDIKKIGEVLRGELDSYNGYHFRKYEKNPDKIFYLGVDSGKNGAFVLLNLDGTIAYKTPIFLDDDKNYDLNRISNFIRNQKRYIIKGALEEVHSIFGTNKSTAFKMGFGLGILKGIFSSNNIDMEYPTPKKWQEEVWKEIVYDNKKGVKDTKSTSLLNAKRIFPGENFIVSPRARKPHDGIVDAALIAYYLKLKNDN